MASGKSCVECGARLLASDIFCTECGAAVGTQHNGAGQTAICLACGEKVEPTDDFCPSCGASLSPSAAPAAPASAPLPSMPLLPLGGGAPEPTPPPITLQPLGGAATVTTGAAGVSSPNPGTPAETHPEPNQPAQTPVQPPMPDSTLQHPVASESSKPTPTQTGTPERKLANGSSIGWAIVGAVIVFGIAAVKWAINVGAQKTEQIRAAAAAPPTPRPLTPEEIDAANNAEAWRVATQRANQAEARQRAEEARVRAQAIADMEAVRESAEELEKATSTPAGTVLQCKRCRMVTTVNSSGLPANGSTTCPDGYLHQWVRADNGYDYNYR